MKHARSSEPSQRQLRVGELLRREIADFLGHMPFDDPALHDVAITVSEVRPSPDLRNASVFVMPLGGRDQTGVLAALNRVAKVVRTAVAHRVDLRHMPEINFVLDDSFDRADHVDALLRSPRVARDLDD